MDADAAAPTRPSPNMPRETLDYFRGDDLRARVFHDKYALRAPDGTVIERTPDLMWRRIARELASVEATPELRRGWEERFYWLLEDFRFIPGGRIMHGAGNHKRVTLLNCFPAGTPVQTKQGFVPIQNVLPGDEVLTHRDRFRLVTHVTEREVNAPLVELACAYLGDQPIQCTPNHRFYALRGSDGPGWVRADELTTDHYVKVDRITETIPLSEIDVLDYLDGGALEEDGAVYTAMPSVAGNGAVVVMESRRIKRRVALDERFGRWLGYFVAEGSVTQHSVYFTVSEDEAHLANEIADLTRDIFGLDASIQHRTDHPGHWMRVYVHSKMLVRFLDGFLAGKTRATNKHLPGWFLHLPHYVQKAFVGAVFAGDATIGDRYVVLFLANPDLIRQIYTMLLRLNVLASIRWEGILRDTRHRGMRITVGTQRYVQTIKAWVRGNLSHDSTSAEAEHNHLCKVFGGELFVKIRRVASIAPARRIVYDLAVEDDHSFTAGWLGAHNCYVIPVHDDSIESIFDWMKEAARTYSLGGGVGTDISGLRPRGAPVNNAARSSTGSVSFMELFSLTTGTIGQSGRRGALMITIADNHPDVVDFVKIKRNLDKVRYANISVRVSDAFMSAVESDREFTLEFRNDRAEVKRPIRARDLWNELIRGARDYAEPGLIFWDQTKRWSTSEYNGMGVITTNPCSEIPLEPYGNCCLGNLCLTSFVTDPFTSQARVNWENLEPALRYATRFLDNVLDYNADKHPLPEQREASLKSRRIGVGFTGLGDMLIKLGLKYDTDEAVTFVDQLFERIKNVVYDESVVLAQEKGVFPAYDVEKHFRSPFIHALAPHVQERIRRCGLRNVALLTVPPVGSGAALAGVTSGIEPIFDLSYIRRSESLSQETFKVYHPLVREYMARHEIEHEEDLPAYFVTAHQIKAEMRVRMQAAIQKHIDHSISSTVNLPKETTPEEVERIYFLAWKLGLKGVTVYRESSREGILLTEQQAQASGVVAAGPAHVVGAPATAGSVQAAPESMTAAETTPLRAIPRPRPKVTVGRTERVETPRGRIYVVVNEDEWGVNEVFVHSFDAEADACGRLASLALRAGVDPREIIEQLWRVQSKEVAFDRSSTGTTVRVTTIAQAVALALGRALYGEAFRPDKEFPRADVLPEPIIKARQEALRFVPPQAASGSSPARAATGSAQIILPPAPAQVASVQPAPVAGGNGSSEFYGDGKGHAERVERAVRLEFVGVCPDCGETLVHENGCATCRSCGYSKC
jgi:ribonucleoside-diphosphate reductase alpha chain